MAKTHRRTSYRKSKRWNPSKDHVAPRRRHHARHNRRVRRMAKINRKSIKKAQRFFSGRRDRRHNPKRSGSYYRAKKAIRGMSRSSRSRMISGVLGSMNPRGRRRGGKAFTKHRSGRKWESTVSGSLPYWANPKRGHRGSRRKARQSSAHWIRTKDRSAVALRGKRRGGWTKSKVIKWSRSRR